MFVKILLTVLAVIFAILQTTVLPVNLSLFLVIIAVFYQSRFSFSFAFFSGLVLDLAQNNLLGTSSLKFLILSFFIFILKNKLPIREKRQLKLPQI